MNKKPSPTTAKKKTPVAGKSPIIPARGVALRPSEDGSHPVAEPTPAAPAIDQMPVENFSGYGRPAQFSDSVARTRARDLVEIPRHRLRKLKIIDSVARTRARDLVEIPANPKLEQARLDRDAAVAAKALSNWEVAMVESLIDLRDLQDVIDAMTAKQEIIRENIKLALAQSESKTFKFNLGAATLAKGAETVTIVDEKKIPFAYMISTPDKAKIGRALRVPQDVEGAKLSEGKPSLRVSWDD